MRGAWQIGWLRGIPLRIHWTTVLTPLAILAYANYNGVSTPGLVWMLVFVVAIYGCVVLHELGHAFVAGRYGVRIHDIVLLPVGGAARFAALPTVPGREAMVTLAGPLVNLGIALLLAPALFYWPRQDWFPWLNNYNVASYVVSLAVFNFAIFVFNLVPAFPLDGGRLMRAVFTNWWPRRRATRYAAAVGKIISILALAYAVAEHSWIIGGFAVYTFLSARREERHTAVQVFLDDVTVGEVASPVWMFSEDDTVAHALAHISRTQQSGAVVTDEYCPIGFAHHRELAFVEDPETRTLGSLDLHPVDMHAASTPVREITRQFSAHPHSIALEEIDGRPVGFVSMDLLEDAYEAFAKT